MKKLFGVLVAFCVGAFLRPAVADTVFNINQTVPNSCIVGVIGVSDNTANATANWSPNTYNCAAGTYLPAGNDWANDSQGCTQCPANSYCAGGTYTYNESSAQGIGSCPSGYASNAGTSTISQCQISCAANTYINITGGAYTRLEYLESTGTQYIDTGIIASGTNYEYSVTFIPRDASAAIIGNQYEDFLTYIGSLDFLGVYLYPSNVDMNAFGWKFDISMTPNVPVNIGVKYDGNRVTGKHENVIVFSNEFNENNHPKNTTGIVNPIHTVLLFANRFDATRGYELVDMGTVAISSVEMYNNGVMVRNFIPARRNSDGVLGMLDLVTGQFFTNAGTGTFVAGPDVGAIGGSCTACAAGYHSAAHTVNYGTADSCTANVINISWKNATGAEQAATTCTYDGAITTPANEPVKRGYTFTGWTLSAQ